jgi:hypothetical protein
VNIGKHNYQEFFLLYVDNELTSDDYQQVELFVAKHPELAEELEMLVETRLLQEPEITFESKHVLYKSTTIDIDERNYEEWLLLLVDNEVSDTEKTQIEQWLNEHPSYKPVFETLCAVRLLPERIIFNEKHLLYHNKKGKVVGFQWHRVGAAAAVLILLMTAWLLTYRDVETSKTEKENVLAFEDIKRKLAPNTVIEKKPNSRNQVPTQLNNTMFEKTTTTARVLSQNTSPGHQHDENVKMEIVLIPPVTIEEEITYHNNAESPVTEIANTGTILDTETSDEDMNEVINTLVQNSLNEKNEQLTAAAFSVQTSMTGMSAYKVIDINDDSQLLIGSMNVNKNKVRSVLRKASKIFIDKSRNITGDGPDNIEGIKNSLLK